LPKKLVGAQAAFSVLAPALRGGSDPSRGPSGNPDPKRRGIRQQHFVEVPGKPDVGIVGPETPGRRTRIGHLDWTTPPVPMRASGTVGVSSLAFAGETFLRFGPYQISTFDFPPSGASVQATASLLVTASPATATLTIGGQALTPAGGPRTPGANDYDETLATPALIAADIVAAINDGANAFAAIATATDAGGGQVDLEAVPPGTLGNAVTLTSSDGTITLSGATFSGGLDPEGVYAIALAAAISGLPGYSASAAGTVITISGPFGVGGNEVLFSAEGISPQNFTLSPDTGALSGAEPSLGPVVLF
jgi:hypothetical protein